MLLASAAQSSAPNQALEWLIVTEMFSLWVWKRKADLGLHKNLECRWGRSVQDCMGWWA